MLIVYIELNTVGYYAQFVPTWILCKYAKSNTNKQHFFGWQMIKAAVSMSLIAWHKVHSTCALQWISREPNQKIPGIVYS